MSNRSLLVGWQQRWNRSLLRFLGRRVRAAVDIEDLAQETGGDLSSATPRHLVKVWTSDLLPGDWRRWTLGGSLQAQSPNFEAGEYCPRVTAQGTCAQEVRFRDIQQFYLVADLRLAYEVNTQWRAALSVNNVFDRVYYQTIGAPYGGNWYGEPRNVLLRIDCKF